VNYLVLVQFMLLTDGGQRQKLTKVAKSGQIAIHTVMNFNNFFLAKGTKQGLYALNAT